MSTILFATDFSTASEIAGQTTRALARHIDASVVCAHAAVTAGAQPDAYEISIGEIEGFRRAFQEEIADRRLRLQQMAEELARGGIKATHQLIEGAVIDAICEAARDEDAALVILGSHGRTGLERIVLGSVAERVVRHCETSVLVARAPAASEHGFRRVLVATDFSESAETALEQAATLAADDAVIDLLHCWQLDDFPDSQMRPTDLRRAHQTLSGRIGERAQALGQGLARRVSVGQRKVTFHLLQSPPTAGIQEFMDEQRAPYDLVAVGTHGRTGVKRWLLGSVAESTVRYAPCSVLVARPRHAQ